jgi:hypothetical protein
MVEILLLNRSQIGDGIKTVVTDRSPSSGVDANPAKGSVECVCSGHLEEKEMLEERGKEREFWEEL